MKVLITHELFPPTIHGGGEKVVYRIAKELKTCGVDVKVVTTGNRKINKYDDIPTFRIPINRYLMNLAIVPILQHVKDVDIVHTNNYNACFPSYIAAKRVGKPIVCQIHEVYNEKWLKMRGFLFGTLSRIVERLQVRHNFDKFIFLSDYMMESAVRIGIPRSKCEIIKPGIDFKKFKMKRKEDYVLFVGNLTKRKGVENLIEAAKRLPDISFKIVGRGPERIRLEKHSPDNVEFLGYVSDSELIDLYSRALIFCLPSIGEGFGLVLLEAMASACAIVSTVPLDYEGIRVQSENVEQLSNAIKYLIDNKNVAKKMGKINRVKAKEYSWDKFTKRILEIYEELIL